MRQGSLLLISILLAHSGLSTNLIGVYEVLVYVGTLFSFFWVTGFLQASVSFYGQLDGASRGSFYFQLLLLFLFLSTLLSWFLLCNGWGLLPFFTGVDAVPYLSTYAGYLLFSLPTYCLEYYLLVRMHGLWLWRWGAFSSATQVLSVMLPLWLGGGLLESFQWLTAWGFFRLVLTIAALYPFGEHPFTPRLLVRFLRYALPVVGSVLLGGMVLMFDNWLVGRWYQDPAVFAVYRYGARELPFTMAIISALGISLMPLIRENRAAGLEALRLRIRRLSHWLFPLTMTLMVVSKPMFVWLFTAQFAESAGLFNIYLLTTASRLWLTNSVVMSLGSNRILLMASLCELLVKAITGLLFIWAWGLTGLAWSAVLSYWVEKGILAVYLRRRHGIELDSWLDLRWFTGYTVGMLVVWSLACA